MTRSPARSHRSRTSIPTSIPPRLLVLGLLVFLPSGSTGLHCFVCSWSAKDFSREDICRPGNFSYSAALHEECKAGCEMVAHFDKSGKEEMFYRNCAQENVPLTGAWITRNTSAGEMRRLACDWALCNESPRVVSPPRLIPVGLLAALPCWRLLFARGS